MKYGIISDIHGNMDALGACLEELDAEGVDEIVCLGDVVGYGAEPSACIEALREREILTIAGNHDWAVVGKTNINYFNSYAKQSTLWCREQCSDEDKAFLRDLPLVEVVEDRFTMVHSTLYAPELFDYIMTTYDAYLCLQLQETPLCFVGHSHLPIVFFQEETIHFTYESPVDLREDVKTLVNVGSVGQPRDENPKACFAIWDTDAETIEIRRVEYDIEAAQEKIREAGLPDALARRLSLGR